MVEVKNKSKEFGWRRWWWLAVIFLPVAVTWALRLFRSDKFESAAVVHSSGWSLHHRRVLEAAEYIGEGLLSGPEDLAYNEEACALFTGCDDGWIKKVSVCGDPTVQNWSYVGSRPIGLAFGPDGELYITDAYKGLLRINIDGEIEVLVEEAGGLKFGLPDGIDVASNGMVYFSDATYKHNLQNYEAELLEGRPYGRLLRYDPSTKLTTVLVDDLFFANGVSLSAKQDFVIYCESIVPRCRKYHIEGEKKGLVESFIEDLPGYPDNIRYDGNGTFWIALAAGKEPELPLQSAGVLAVDVDGNPLALYTNHGLSITSGTKIGNSLYFGSLKNSFIIRLDLAKLPTTMAT